ncbi:MAG: hypothetical protein Q4B13_08995 [Lautropia sp.]|nr:hypothetical protein [Lautropia sp.]
MITDISNVYVQNFLKIGLLMKLFMTIMLTLPGIDRRGVVNPNIFILIVKHFRLINPVGYRNSQGKLSPDPDPDPEAEAEADGVDREC